MAKLKKLPVYLTREEFNRLLAVVSSLRDRFILQALYYLGLRVGELSQAQAEDFDLKTGMYTVRAECAKRKKERHVPIPKPFQAHVRAYLELAMPEGRVFALTTTRLWQIVKRYAAMAKIKKRVTPHVLRHSYATAVYQEKHDPLLLKELLGHASLSTTMIYTHMSDADLKTGVDGVFEA